MDSLGNLKTKIAGTIVTPEDKTYDDARSVLFKKGRPVAIVRVSDAKDVSSAITYAKTNNLLLSVRSGGHSGAGFGTNDNGIVIDVSALNSVDVIDKDAGIVRIGAGAHWVDAAKTLHEYGLALSSGDTTSVGAGGLTLGGGIGWMVRKYGLTIDSLIGAEIVTSDGNILHIDKDHHDDLFWAIRGGGGNFGVVTYFEFKAHPVGDIYAGHFIYKMTDLASVMKKWRDNMKVAPAELTSMFLLFPSFGGNPPMAMMHFCVATDNEEAAKVALAPFEQIGEVSSRELLRKPYYEVIEIAHPPEGVRVIAHATFMQDFDDDAVETMVKEGLGHNLILQVRHVGGAMNTVPNEETAFAHRHNQILIVSPTFVAPDATHEEIETADAPWQRIAKHGKGSYGNLLSEMKDIHEVYPSPTYERLQIVKRQYDPDNLFNQNFNITP